MSDDDDIDLSSPSTTSFDPAVYKRERDLAIAAGTWQPFVPASKVVDHILELRAQGMTLRAISEAAGISLQAISKIHIGKTSKVKTHVAAQVFGVRFIPSDADRHTPWATRRRIGALMAKGWPQTMIAEFAGVNHSHLNSMMRPKARVDTIPAATVDGVKRVYAELADQDGPRALARKIARANGYPPPEAWTEDELEDPEPSTIDRVWKRWSDAHPMQWFERLKDARETAGYTVAEAAVKLGIGSQPIYGWESGERAPRKTTRAKVAKLYGESVEYLFED